MRNRTRVLISLKIITHLTILLAFECLLEWQIEHLDTDPKIYCLNAKVDWRLEKKKNV